MRPKQVGAAARRIAAKMVADQAVPLMMSMVGCSGDPSDPEIGDDFAVVIVARGEGARRVLEWIRKTTGRPASVEIEPAEPE